MDAVTAHTTGTSAAGLASRAARWVMVLVWVAGVSSGVLAGYFAPPQPLLLVAYALALTGAFLLTDPRDRPLTGIRALSIPAVSLTITLLVLLGLRDAGDVWLIDYAAYLIALQTARGNPVLGLGGVALQAAAVILWALSVGHDPGGIVTMLTIPIAVAVLGIVWRRVLHGLVRRERRHRSAEACSERRIRAAEEAARHSQSELDAIRDRVSPVLRRLRDGAALDADFLADIRVLEGGIRDRIRAPRLQHPLIEASVAAARARGASVTVLADVADERRIGAAAAAAISDLIRGVPAGSSSVIAATGERGARISVVVDAAGEHERHVIEDAPASP